MRKKFYLIILLSVLLSGCSVFKSSTKDESINVEQKKQNDITTEQFESIDIEIPPALFAALQGVDIPPPDTSHTDTSDIASNVSQTPERTHQPVKVTINRHTKTQDNSTVERDSTSHTITKQETKRETRSIFGFAGWIIVGVFAAIIGIAWVAIRYYL